MCTNSVPFVVRTPLTCMGCHPHWALEMAELVHLGMNEAS